jgi:hypothetical protein
MIGGLIGTLVVYALLGISIMAFVSDEVGIEEGIFVAKVYFSPFFLIFLLITELSLLAFRFTRMSRRIKAKAKCDATNRLAGLEGLDISHLLIEIPENCNLEFVENPVQRFLWFETYKREYNNTLRVMSDESWLNR